MLTTIAHTLRADLRERLRRPAFLLIPALALALGVWSGSPRLFEIVYLILWYGALNSIPVLSAASADPAQIAARGLLALALLVVAALGRRRS